MKHIILAISLLLSFNVYAYEAIDGYEYLNANMIEFDGINGSPSVSLTNQAKVYFDVSSGKLKCSQNGGAYADCVGGGGSSQWTTSGSNIYFNTGNVGIGTSGTLSNGIFEIRGNPAAGTTAGDFVVDSANKTVSVGRLSSTGGDNSKFQVRNRTGLNGFYIDTDQAITYFDRNVTGNIGIGTTSASALLNLSMTNSYDLFRVDDNGGNDTTPFIINKDGNVGIGTTLSVNKIDLGGTGVGNGIGFGGGAVTLSGSTNVLYTDGFITTNNAEGLAFGGISTTAATSIRGSQATSTINLYAGGNSTLNIVTTNVGIGSVTPTAMLDIASTANQILFRIQDNGVNDSSPYIINADGNVGIGTITAGGVLTIPSLKSSSGTRYLCIDTTGVISSSASACSGT